MKRGLSAREKVLLLILILMAIFAGYYYAFYLPTQEKITFYEEEAILVDDQIIIAEAKTMKMSMMNKELAAIKAGDMTNIKELPPYDNSRNVMNSLSAILANATQYDVSFSGVTEEDGIVRRDITLNYSCNSYDAAKSILSQIYNGDYRCLMKDLHITQSSGVWNVNVQITYFEYK